MSKKRRVIGLTPIFRLKANEAATTRLVMLC
jgi:hypothetical protein